MRFSLLAKWRLLQLFAGAKLQRQLANEKGSFDARGRLGNTRGKSKMENGRGDKKDIKLSVFNGHSLVFLFAASDFSLCFYDFSSPFLAPRSPFLKSDIGWRYFPAAASFRQLVSGSRDPDQEYFMTQKSPSEKK